MYQYKARLRRVVDGDTVKLDIDLGFNMWVLDESFRLAHIDAPEMSTEQGKAARVFLISALSPITVLSLNSLGQDKYGRWLAEIVMPDGSKLHDLMIAAGHAKPYEGGKR